MDTMKAPKCSSWTGTHSWPCAANVSSTLLAGQS
jgi:hypothetical protein